MQKDAAVSVVLLPCVINPTVLADHPTGKKKEKIRKEESHLFLIESSEIK